MARRHTLNFVKWFLIFFACVFPIHSGLCVQLATILGLFVVLCVLYGLWRLYDARQMRSRAYQKRFAKLSAADLNRLVDHMKKPLNRAPLPPPSVDPTGWRLEGVDGQQVWVHLDAKRSAAQPQNATEKYHVGVPLSASDAPSLPKPTSAADAALNGARFMARIQVSVHLFIRLSAFV